MASLLTASGGRLELAPNRIYVLGRGPECDFVLDDSACSREHVRLTVGGTASTVLIEDLGSKNGTFVDGEQLRGRILLTDGSRIQVGSTVYILSMLDVPGAGVDVLLETGTVAYDPQSSTALRGVIRTATTKPKAGFAGQLSLFPFLDLLQLLMRTQRSGTLHIEAVDRRGKLEVRKGEVFAAVCGEFGGMEALLELADLEDGLFWLVETEKKCKRRLKLSGDGLLFELCRTLDERRTA